MQEKNNLQINITGRHIDITPTIRDYAEKKITSLHLDFPKVVSAKVIVDVENYRHLCEIILFCANHITIEASSQTEDLYAAIDETIAKISRRMRKFKTKFQKKNRNRKETIRHLHEEIYSPTLLDDEESDDTNAQDKIQSYIIHKEKYQINPMYTDEAILDLEISSKSFIIFENQRNHKICIVYKRKTDDYGLIEIDQLSE